MEAFFQKNKIMLIFVLIAVFIAGVLLFYINDLNKTYMIIIEQKDFKAEKTRISSKRAIFLAEQEAKRWSEDVKLADIQSGSDANAIGESKEWTLRFSSVSKEKKGFEVKIENKKIVSAEEIDFNRQGGDSRNAGIISQKEAIGKLRSQKGFENISVESVSLYYEQNDGNWYYGIKTEKGMVAIRANKES